MASYEPLKLKMAGKGLSGNEACKQVFVSMFIWNNNTKTSIRVTWIELVDLLNNYGVCLLAHQVDCSLYL